MLVNALLVRWALGYREVEDAASIAAHGRHEGFLSLGAAQSEAEVDRVAAAYFARFANPATATTVGVEPTGVGDAPYLDWSVADYVTAPDSAGAPASLRVVSLAVTEDEEGNPIYTPELDTLGELYEQHLDRWLARMADGTLGGAAASASPMTSIAASATPADRRVFLAPFSQAGPVTAGTSGEWESEVGFRLLAVVARVRDVGTTDTVLSVKRNGVHLGEVTIDAGLKRGVEPFAVAFEPEADVLSFEVTDAGVDAEDLVVMPRGV